MEINAVKCVIDIQKVLSLFTPHKDVHTNGKVPVKLRMRAHTGTVSTLLRFHRFNYTRGCASRLVSERAADHEDAPFLPGPSQFLMYVFMFTDMYWV